MLKKLLLSALIATLSISTAFASYNDVDINHRNYNGISYLELQGAIDAGEDFRPDDTLTRAELYKILFESFGENGENIKTSKTFEDVPQDSWFAPYVELGLRYDVLSSGGKFRPEKGVSRIEAIKLLFRMYNVASPLVNTADQDKLFADVGPGHPKYSLVNRAIGIGIIERNPHHVFRPYQNITRGDFADLLFAFDQWYISRNSSEQNLDLTGIHKAEIFADIWKRINTKYPLEDDEVIDVEVLYQAAIKGLISSLNDPYTVYIPPADAQEFSSHLSGSFEGIGAYLIQDEKTGALYITDFVNGSNAREVGIKAGDEIIEVDGVSIAGMDLEEIIARVKGPAGTSVTLKIRRNGQSYTYSVERRELQLTIVSHELLENDIWYIDLNLFSDTSFIDFTSSLKALQEEAPEPEAIVIDLRGNGGGYMNSATSIAGHFVPNSEPILQMDYGSFTHTTLSSGQGEYYGKDIYVLIDEFSASASEVVAGALQEMANATVVGHTSFGKGTAQEVTQYWDGSIFKLTIAHWLTPLGNSIENLGITPDIEVTGESSTVDLWLEKVYDDAL